MANKVTCTCGHSWNKSDSSKKDATVCHICGKDNVMKNGGWLDNYGEEANANEGTSSASKEWIGEGYSTKGRNYSPAWGGQFAMGGSIPGSVGFTYARTKGIPSEGPYAKKTMPSAQKGENVPVETLIDPATNSTYAEPISEAMQFTKDWMNSPMYQKMLEESTGKRAYNLIDKQRRAAIEDGKIKYYEESIDPKTGAETEFTGKGKSEVYLNKDTKYPDWSNNVAHELSHVTDLGGFYIPLKDRKLMYKYATHNIKESPLYEEANQRGEVNELKSFTNYVNAATETRARLNTLRKVMREQNVYDPFTQSFSKDMFDKYKQMDIDEKDKKEGKTIGMDPYQQLKMSYTDEEIEDMMNKISKSGNDEMVPIAQNGEKVIIDGKEYDTASEEYKDLYRWGPNDDSKGGIGYFDKDGVLVTNKMTLPEHVVYPKSKTFQKFYDNLYKSQKYAVDQLTKKYGQVDVDTQEGSGIFSGTAGHYNPLTNRITINPNLSIIDPLDVYVAELAHKVQFDKQGKFDVIGDWIFNDLPAYAKRSYYNIMGDRYKAAKASPYKIPGTVENEAHRIYEPRLQDEADDYEHEDLMGYNYNKYKTGGWLNKYVPEAQNGLFIPGVTDFKMSTPTSESTRVPQRDYELEREIALRNKMAAQPQLKQGRANTAAEEKERIRKNKVYASKQPNAKVDKQGNVSRINPNRSVTGAAENFMSRREDKAAEHIMGALDAAGYITGAAELGQLGYGALKKFLKKKGLIKNSPSEFLELSPLEEYSFKYTPPKQKYFTPAPFDKEVKKEAFDYLKLTQDPRYLERVKALDAEARAAGFESNLEDKLKKFWKQGEPTQNRLNISKNKENYFPFNITTEETVPYVDEYGVNKDALGISSLSPQGYYKWIAESPEAIQGKNFFPEYRNIKINTPLHAKRNIGPRGVVHHELKHHWTNALMDEPYYSNVLKSSVVPEEVNSFLPRNNFKYFSKDTEIDAHLMTNMRDEMVKKGILKDHFDNLTKEKLSEFITKNPEYRGVKEYFKPGKEIVWDRNKFISAFNKALPVTVPAGIGAAVLQQKKKGGVIKDNEGYWNPDNWGKTVEIDSPYITMQGVNQPLLGISDTGDVQYMEPGQDYEFDGSKVREFPMTKQTKTVNQKETGGWLSQYK